MDAIDLLKKDHRDIERLFSAFDQARDADEQRDIFRQIADALTIHTQIEEAHFYPTIRVVDDELVHLALEEHLQIKQLIADLLDMDPNDEQFAIKVSVLQQEVEQHVGEEEGELFPAVQRMCEPDLLDAMAQQMMATRAEIEAEAAPRADVSGDSEPARY
jgi:hemerythrin superfamily protein